jgi:hypothetical protein
MEVKEDNFIYCIFKIDHSIINKNALSKEKKEVHSELLFTSSLKQRTYDRLSEIMMEYSNSSEYKIIYNNPSYLSVYNNQKVAGLLSYSRNTDLVYEYLILSIAYLKK